MSSIFQVYKWWTQAFLWLVSPLVPDAFGAPRTDGKIAYGPLNAPTAGLMLLVR